MDRLLEGLDDQQRAAVSSTAQPLCILAGAGAGKTRVLTRRIGHRILEGSAEAPHVLALTFTRKAAGELRRRLGTLGVGERIEAGTFHAVAYAQLRQRWAEQGRTAPTLLERKARLLAPLLGRPQGGRRLQPADVAGEIEWAKARMVTPEGYESAARAAGRTPPAPAAEIARLYEAYEQRRKRAGLVDFDDLLLLCARAMEDDAEFAATQRWRFRHLFVDEFQDVNPVQHRLLMGWLGDRVDLCVVGDPNQAIYSWNGAEPDLLARFPEAFPTAEVLRLDANYRCPPQVVAVAAAVLPDGAQQHRSAAEDGPVPTVRSFVDERAEARGIAALLRRAHPGKHWSEMAVLVRTNAQTVELQRALQAARVPCRVRGGGFLDQPEVKDALSALRAVRTTDPVRTWARDLEASLEEAPPERRANLEALLGLAHEHLTASGGAPATPEAFLSWLTASTRDEQPGESDDAVELSTFHRAKGLEWPLVVVAGMEEGLVPVARSVDIPAALAEEHRLVYVALTRSSHTLHCTWAEQRTFGSRSARRSPSPLLAMVEAACAAIEGTGPVDWRRHLEEGRRKVAAAKAASSAAAAARGAGRRPRAVSTLDEADPLVHELRQWRLETARAAQVPAYVVFHDATLAAIVEARPRTLRDLQSLPGLGPVKASRFGDAVLSVVARHADPAA